MRCGVGSHPPSTVSGERLRHATASAQVRTAVRSAVDSKACRRCQGVKGADEFYVSKQTSDGLQSYCKVCYAQTSQGRRSKEPKEQREREPANSPCAHAFPSRRQEFHHIILSSACSAEPGTHQCDT